MTFSKVFMLCILVLVVLLSTIGVKWNATDVSSNISHNFMEPLPSQQEELIFYFYENATISIPGKPFDPNLRQLLSEFGLIAQHQTDEQMIKAEDVVFVTYASSNHFLESRAGLYSLRKLLPNQIVYYDVGLLAAEANDIKSFCNLEYRRFDFDRYPKHVGNLMNYAFKAIIEAELFAASPVFWMFDSSLRIENERFLLEFYDQVQTEEVEKFVLPFSPGLSIFSATHPGIFNYLSMPESKRKSLMAGATSFIVRSDFSREAVKWMFLCAMTEQCIAPEGHSVNCHFSGDKVNDHANCHRYDQSAINIILSSLRRKYNVIPYSKLHLRHNFLNVKRGDKYRGSLKGVCRSSNI